MSFIGLEIIVGKGENAWKQDFLHFPQCFPKHLFKSQDWERIKGIKHVA